MSYWGKIMNNGIFDDPQTKKKLGKKYKKSSLNSLYRSIRHYTQGLSDENSKLITIDKCIKLLVNHYGLEITASKKNAAEIIRLVKESKVSAPPKNTKKKEPKIDLNDFYKTWEWKKARYNALKNYGAKCQCCGATGQQSRIVVDHIKPIRFHWDLRCDQNNLQVLCNDCNMGKSYQDQTDWRVPESKTLPKF